MNTERFWETPLRAAARFSERLITLEQLEVLPDHVRRAISYVFWGYHVVLVVLVFAHSKIGFLDRSFMEAAVFPLIVLWAVYAFHFVVIYLPTNGLHSLYTYLKGKDVPPAHSIFISATSLVGTVATIGWLLAHV